MFDFHNNGSLPVFPGRDAICRSTTARRNAATFSILSGTRELGDHAIEVKSNLAHAHGSAPKAGIWGSCYGNLAGTVSPPARNVLITFLAYAASRRRWRAAVCGDRCERVFGAAGSAEYTISFIITRLTTLRSAHMRAPRKDAADDAIHEADTREQCTCWRFFTKLAVCCSGSPLPRAQAEAKSEPNVSGLIACVYVARDNPPHPACSAAFLAIHTKSNK